MISNSKNYNEGFVVWITGLSGAGKTTISERIVSDLRGMSIPTIFLDGDMLRAILNRQNMHTPENRKEVSFTYSRLCKELSEQGFAVVCATISLNHDVHTLNRDTIDNYFEVYLKVPIDDLIKRDPKGIYARGAKGLDRNIVGIDHNFEEPLSPDLVIMNDAKSSIEKHKDLIIQMLSNLIGCAHNKP